MNQKNSHSKIRKGVILVGGYGTRFLPATKAQPKEMLPVVDKPVVQYIVEEMVASGIKDIIFITSSTKRAIEDHFDTNFELEYRLKESGKMEALKEIKEISNRAKFAYTRQSEPLGTGHALLCAKDFLNDEPFAFSDGDSIIYGETPTIKSLIDVFEKYGGPVVAVHEVDKKEVSKYGIIDGEEVEAGVYRIKGTVEKPDVEDAPTNIAILGMRYILTPDIFPILENTKPGKGGEIWLNDAMNILAKERDTYAYKYGGIYYDCGNKLGYLKAVVEFGLRHEELNGDFRKYLEELVG